VPCPRSIPAGCWQQTAQQNIFLLKLPLISPRITAVLLCTKTCVQGGSSMTRTNRDLFTHNQSRSYFNHLVFCSTHIRLHLRHALVNRAAGVLLRLNLQKELTSPSITVVDCAFYRHRTCLTQWNP
jgi:hypothetical protein